MSNTTHITTKFGTLSVTPMFDLDGQGRRRESGILVPVITMTDLDGNDVSGSCGPVRNHPVAKFHFGDFGFREDIADQVDAACAAIRESAHNKAIRAAQNEAINYSLSRDESESINGSL